MADVNEVDLINFKANTGLNMLNDLENLVSKITVRTDVTNLVNYITDNLRRISYLGDDDIKTKSKKEIKEQEEKIFNYIISINGNNDIIKLKKIIKHLFNIIPV